MDEWHRAACLLRSEGVTLASERARGGHAAGYFDKVMDRAMALKRAKPLPLPPRPLPLPLPLPLPGA